MTTQPQPLPENLRSLTLDLGPVRCPVDGCWSVHGIPDQCAAARETALAEHLASDEHRQNVADLTAAVAQPLDTAAIQAARAAATAGLWWADAHEIYAGPTGIPAASVWVGETCDVNLLDGGEADAAAIVSAHNALPALLARVADLEQQLAACNDLRQRAIDKGDKDRERIRELEAENERLRQTSWPPHFGTPHNSIGDAIGSAMEHNARLAANSNRPNSAR